MTVQSSSPQPNQQPAGWYDVGQGWARYWDGQNWSEAVTHEALRAQQAAQQPAEPPAASAASPQADYQQPGYQQPGYQQPGYQQPGYQPPGPQDYQDPHAGYQQPGHQQPGYQPPGPQDYQDPHGGHQQPPAPPGYQQPASPGQALQGALAGLQIPDLAAKGPGGLPVILFPAIIAGAALLVLLGSLLPWATIDTGFGSFSVRGTEGDGVLTLLLALAGGAAAVAVVMARKPMAAIGGIVAGGLSLLIAGYDFLDLARVSGGGGLVEAHVGFGLWLVLLGSLAMTGASIAILVLNKEQSSGAAPTSAW
ncbi:MAG: hypothetical protein R2761_01040 [Acidimicrobiales bacterium]